MRGTSRGTETSVLRIIPAALVATLILSGVAVCGVAATGGAEFSVESFEPKPAPNTQTVATGSASTDTGTTAGVALGLTAPASGVGLELGGSSADVPMQSTTEGVAQSITVPPQDAVAIELPDVNGNPSENPANGEAASTPEAVAGDPIADTSSPEQASTEQAAAEPGVDESALATFAESGVSTHQTEIESTGETEQAAELEDVDTDRQPFAAVGGITLYGPANQIRAAGFHESANTQALEMRELDSPLETMVMPSRGRGTGGHTAADMAVYPDEMIFSPVTGTVVDARPYKLYCKYDDHVVIIKPDAADDRLVKVLHLGELLIANGDRVIAGTTPIATGPTPLPFSSQIDSYVENATNTHVHIETVDLNRVDATNSTVCP